MKEKGMFFTDEQKELLKEIDFIEKNNYTKQEFTEPDGLILNQKKEEPQSIHLQKYTDLGAFSIEIMKVLVAKNYDPAMGFANSYEDMASISKNLAKELIKQLNEENK